jgi:AraC-like DNA-binding protein
MEALTTQRTRFLRPAAGLEGVVRFYVQREAPLPHADLVYPVPAQAAPILEFILADPFEIHWCERPLVEATPAAVLIGLQTHRRVRLVTKGTLETFCIVFQPAGVFRLFRLPCAELTNHDHDARAVIGPIVTEFHDRLGGCRSFEARARVADRLLLGRCLARPGGDPVSAAANEILRRHGRVHIAGLASRVGLSLRQFERRFTHQIGMRPKLYARIARFEAALDSRARSTSKSWTDVAHECGYHDQMHLIHDFEEFSGETPTTVLSEVEQAHREFLDAVRRGRMSCGDQDPGRLLL